MKSGESRVKTCTLLVTLLASTTAIAAKSNADQAGVDKIVQGGMSQTVAQSIHVVRMSDGKTLYEKDADQLVSPASVTKLVTTAAVLAKFTPRHTFKTKLLHSGGRKNEKIQGDLYVVGDGDPFVVSEKLWQLAADIKNMGIREFSGDLVIDNSLFGDAARDGERKFAAKGSRNAYDAPVSAFGVNFNTFAVTIAPSDQIGKPAHVAIDPYPLRGVVIESSVRTTKAKAGKNLDVKRTTDNKVDDKLTASGTIAVDGGIAKVYRSVGDHVQSAGEYLKAFLKSEGVIVRGKVREGVTPAAATELIEMESYEMRRIVAGLNTFSNNYIADVLVKRLGAAFPRSGEPDQRGSGTYDNGIAVIRDFLKKDVGIKSEFILENGSGLATENRITARQVTDILTYMERHMEVFPEFLASLPATGWDGTLKKRFGKGDTETLKGLVRAKTGTLSDPISVAGLAGYYRHPKHGMVGFCIIENGSEGKAQPPIADLRDRQDKVLVALMNDM